MTEYSEPADNVIVLRVIHKPDPAFPEVCTWCGDLWPCQAYQLADRAYTAERIIQHAREWVEHATADMIMAADNANTLTRILTGKATQEPAPTQEPAGDAVGADAVSVILGELRILQAYKDGDPTLALSEVNITTDTLNIPYPEGGWAPAEPQKIAAYTRVTFHDGPHTSPAGDCSMRGSHTHRETVPTQAPESPPEPAPQETHVNLRDLDTERLQPNVAADISIHTGTPCKTTP